ncbi:MAG: penicillin acylase family protein [Gammaproteobacteria bacterium]|jgi:acyl-homoserine lactone acylase PvdQ
MRLRPLPFWLSAALLLMGLAAAATVYVLARRAEPVYDGELVLAGLRAPVTVDYGPHAVPTVRAETLDDLLFAQGFVTASERMWQMDLLRRAARGRLAEAFGEHALPVDRLMRTLGLARAAQRNLAALGAQARDLLRAYAEGVNAYRTRAGTRPPLEYLLTRLEPAPWTPLDSLVIIEYMAYLLSFNAREELAFLRVARQVGPERARELFPAGEAMPPEPLPAGLDQIRATLADPFAAADKVSAGLGLPRPGPASNAWALAAGRTADHRPILANDPHLLASLPNIWFEQELVAPGLHATGASIPGLPLVLIGHNADLAWGMTTTMADTQDLVIERLTGDGRSVQRPGGSEPVREHWESIPVRGGRTHRLRIRETSNGVILSDVLAEERGLPQDFVTYEGDDLLALRSTNELPDAAFEGLYRLNTARSIDAAREAVTLIVHASQNVLIAHRGGGIAWQVSGRLPVREHSSGKFPVPGWIAGYGWDGYVPEQANPHWIDPPEGQLVSANNRSVAPDYPVQPGHSWMAPYRAQRIEALLGRRSDLTLDDMVAIQMDQLSIEARHYQAALKRIAPELRALDREAWTEAERLLAWDARFKPDSQAAALFVLLRRALFHALLGDELGSELSAYMDVALLAYNGLQETVRSGHSSFWDDTTTAETEGPAEIWVRALRRARDELEVESGGAGTLGDIRRLVFPHAFSGQPLLGHLFQLGPLPSGGDDYTVNVRKAEASRPQRPLFIPGYRVLFTPGAWAASRSVQPLGQSGHRFSPLRSDQLADWQAGRTHALAWNGPPPERSIGRLRLLPARGAP